MSEHKHDFRIIGRPNERQQTHRIALVSCKCGYEIFQEDTSLCASCNGNHLGFYDHKIRIKVLYVDVLDTELSAIDPTDFTRDVIMNEKYTKHNKVREIILYKNQNKIKELKFTDADGRDVEIKEIIF